MIRTFKHRGLKRLYEHGDHSQIRSERRERIEDILSRLDVAVIPQDLDLPGYGLHKLRGRLKGFWAIKVTGNWRITFCFKESDVFNVNLIDYH